MDSAGFCVWDQGTMSKKTFVMKTLLLGLVFWGAVVFAQAQCSKRLLAYYPYYNGGYKSAKIPFSELTHICHAFIDINSDGTISIPGGFLEPALLTSAHAVGVKVLVSVGGSDVTTFSGVSANPVYTNNFANAIYNFISTYNYDGVDIDWEFPASLADKNNGVSLVQAIRTKFNSSPAPAPTWLISMAVQGVNYTGTYMNYAALDPLMSFYNVMTYDNTGDWADHTSHNSPITLTSASDPTYIGSDLPGTCAKEMNYMITSKGVPASMINMGVPFYGWRFPSQNNIYVACSGSVCTGAYEVNYQTIPALISAGWVRTWDPVAEAPYLTNGTSFLSYDDAESVTMKTDYALNVRGVGGVFMWEVSQDYTASLPHQPLLDAMYSVWQAACSANTATNTPTKTATQTPTNTFTVTSTNTPTDTMNTSTYTNTPTQTPTSTATSTPTITYTNTATNTATDTANTPTYTDTSTSTATNTITSTATNTPTLTPTSTPTWTYTPVPTNTPTPTSTPTITPTPGAGGGGPSLYPNPIESGTTVRVHLNLTAKTDVRVEIFTTAFRKVQDQDYPQQPPGVDVAIGIVDMKGTPLANGLYYIVVTTSQKRSVQKLLILK